MGVKTVMRVEIVIVLQYARLDSDCVDVVDVHGQRRKVGEVDRPIGLHLGTEIWLRPHGWLIELGWSIQRGRIEEKVEWVCGIESEV